MMITTYGALRNDDIIRIQGYRFIVRNIRIAAQAGAPSGVHTPPHRADVIRFEGVCADRCDITATSYNGGTYGAYADVPCSAERLICDRCGSPKPAQESCGCFDNGCQ